ncbi:MAG: acyl-CoA dehydrogenase, partial [Chloroflexi bacterium]|nr:acyl-CoA dehydrogenase [Chloroflexota bacterium]
MDFNLSEEQQMLRNSARDFLTTECPKSVVRELEASESGHLPELWQKMADLGWTGLPIPEVYGGAGLSLLDLAVLFEEIGRAAMPGPLFATVVLGAMPIAECGTEEQKKTILPKVAAGKLILTLALSEPEVLSDLKWIATKAVREGDGFSLTGTKVFVPYAHIADSILVAARTSGSPGEEKGLTVFIVDAKAPGIALTPLKSIAADKVCEVVFDRARISPDSVLGKIDEGMAVIGPALTRARAIQCAEMVGGAQQELEITAEYTKKRVQFNRP